MDTINIVCKLNEDDSFSISDESLEINLTNKNKYHYTFWETGVRHNKNLKSLPNFYSAEGLDLLYLSLFVYYADRRIQREMFPDAWTRTIKLYVPVLSISKWTPQKELLEEMLSFLSGDIWDIGFRERELNDLEKDFQKKLEKDKGEKLHFETFCMLSGGLDSYIGAIDLLEQSDNIAFVNHYGGGPSGAKFIEYVETSLKAKYIEKNAEVFKFHAAPLNALEDSMRTRSFMFFAHAIALASAMNHGIDLIIPENGLISLNIPLTNSRIGSSSTRTTHPYYMSLLQELINNLDIPVSLYNPYQFITKGEMLHECRNDVLLTRTLAGTMSCSHPDVGRYQGESKPIHCGTCLPCIIRRASIKKANIEDNSIYRDSNFSSGKTAANNLQTYKMGIEKYKNSSIRIYSKIQMAGPLYGELSKYKSLYERGMQELIDLLEE